MLCNTQVPAARPKRKLGQRQAGGAVSDVIGADADGIQQRDEKIRYRRLFRADMPAGLPFTCMARDQQRQIVVRVYVAVAQRTAIEDRRMVEQVAVAVRSGLQLLQEVGEQFGV